MVQEEYLIDEGGFSKTLDFKILHDEIVAAIMAIVWPAGTKQFTIQPKKHGNGVKPIKDAFILSLKDAGWLAEVRLDIEVTRSRPGPIDAVKLVGDKYYAVEWETGNISSSHRALSKMAIGIADGKLHGGTLVVSSSKLYPFLTDRIGSFGELAPYFRMFKSMKPANGVLTVIAVEHDAIDPSVPLIGKGTDGRALR